MSNMDNSNQSSFSDRIIRWWRRVKSNGRPVTGNIDETTSGGNIILKMHSQFVVWKKDAQVHDVVSRMYSAIQYQNGRHQNFVECQEFTMSKDFQSMSTKFLQLLVTTNNTFLSLTTSNMFHNRQIFAKYSRSLSMALVIAQYPQDVICVIDYQNDDVPSQPDDSIEGRLCIQTAKILTRLLRKSLSFLKDVVSSSSLPSSSLDIDLLRGYYFLIMTLHTLVEFNKAFQDWRSLDAARMAQTLEISFVHCYSLILVSEADDQKSDKESSDSDVINAAQLQLSKIKEAMTHVMGSTAAGLKIEELLAFVQAGLQRRTVAIDDGIRIVDNSSRINRGEPVNNREVGASSFDMTSIDVDTTNQPQADLESLPSVTVPVTSAEDQIMLDMLDKLVSLSGGQTVDQLVYEILLDRNYQLPSPKRGSPESLENMQPPPATATSLTNPDSSLSLGERLRRSLIDVMNDRLVWSLKRSQLSSCEDIKLHDMIPIQLHLPASGAETADVNAMKVYQTAKVAHIHMDASNSSKVSFDVKFVVDGAIERGVQCQRVKLSSAPRNPILFLTHCRGILTRLAGLTPRRVDIQKRLFESLDFSLLHQMIVNDAMSPLDLADICIRMMAHIQELQAPVRIDVSKRWLEKFCDTCVRLPSFDDVVSYIPIFFEYASSCIDEVIRDMANYYIVAVSDKLRNNNFGYRFLASRFLQPPPLGPGSLDATASLVAAQIFPSSAFEQSRSALLEAGYSRVPSEAEYEAATWVHFHKAILARSFVALLQIPARLTSPEVIVQRLLPETLRHDAVRLSQLRDAIDRLSLLSVLVISIRQALGRIGVIAHTGNNNFIDEELEFQYRLDALLSEDYADFAHMHTECLRHIRSCIQKSLGSFEANRRLYQLKINDLSWEGYIEKTIRDVISDKNPILQLFTKRIYKVLLRGLLGNVYTEQLPSYSLDSKAQRKSLTLLVTEATTLFEHNYKVYQPIYDLIVKRYIFRQ